MQSLLGLNDKQFIVFKEAEKWIKKRTGGVSKYKEHEEYLEYAKQLFKLWDDDGSGVLELEELTNLLITL